MQSDRKSRRLAQERLVEAAARHSVWLHRVGTTQAKRAQNIVDALGAELASTLAERLDSLTPAELQAFAGGRYTTNRLKGLRSTINTWAQDMGSRIDKEIQGGLKELASSEAEHAHRLLSGVLASDVAAGVTGAAAYAAAKRRPVLGELVSDMISDIPAKARKQVYARLRQGISQGETTPQIVRALRGTKALQYKDGLLQTARNDVERVVRTATNHVSNVAYDETYQALGVQYVVWTSTLDGRTSSVCASRDGQRYEVGSDHPRPPAHPNCRSVLVPSLDDEIMGERPYVRAFEPIGQVPKGGRTKDMVGQVSSKTNYSQWFGRQPASFQREWLGPTRYQLYKKGGYKIDRFVDPVGKQLTISELRAKDTATFKELFG